MKRSPNPENFLTAPEASLVDNAIKEAEGNTSAEIKLVVVRHCWDSLYKKAARIFKKLELQNTEQRNCVLVLLSTANREFLIYGDKGIHEKVGQGFWDDVRTEMLEKFRLDEFGQGIADGIRAIGEKLCEHFPKETNDQNEVPNEIAYED